MNKSILSNVKFYQTNSLEYEQDVHSISFKDDTLKQQQEYSYGLPNQDDIYQYRYGSFTTGSRDVDLMPTPYKDIKLPETKKDDLKDTFSEDRDPIDLQSAEENLCGFEEDGVTSACGGKNSRKKLYKIMDPKFNLREAAKNCILLEDHLFHSGKQCSDCIKKHCLMIEGFLEEGITLDKKNEHKDEFVKANNEFRLVFKRLAEKLKNDTLTDEDCNECAQDIRKIRKPLCQKYATFF